VQQPKLIIHPQSGGILWSLTDNIIMCGLRVPLKIYASYLSDSYQ